MGTLRNITIFNGKTRFFFVGKLRNITIFCGKTKGTLACLMGKQGIFFYNWKTREIHFFGGGENEAKSSVLSGKPEEITMFNRNTMENHIFQWEHYA